MIDPTHLPDEKPWIFIKPLFVVMAAWELSPINFWISTITWTIKILAGIYCAINIYEYILSEYRHSKWAKGGFKPEEKEKYRIK